MHDEMDQGPDYAARRRQDWRARREAMEAAPSGAVGGAKCGIMFTARPQWLPACWVRPAFSDAERPVR